MSSIQTPPQTPRRVSSHRRAKTLAPSPVRTPLGPRPTLQHSRSSGTLARQFVDTHSTTYAHLYEHEDDGITREKLEAEQRRLEEERRRGREMRERMMRMKLGGEKENVATGSGETKTRAASWRPLSLVAKRQGGGAGHVRSASHQLPSSLLAGPSLRSVSDTPTSLCITHMAHAPSPSRSPAHSTHSQPLRVVIERSDSPYHSEEGQIGNTSVSSDPKSTYSWASSFSGETAELRATATYLRQSLDNSRRVSANIPEGDEAEHNGATETEAQETLDTPDKVKRRRKRIVAIAHTVRQLEGVGSREAEDPNFYGQLVKAWNDRPGFAPVAAPPLHGPPALLPPPNLPPPPPADPYQYPPPMSPAFERHFGSPADPQLYTPAMGYAGPSTAEEVYEYDDQASDFSGEFRSRSFRNSYASALHDLALEGGEGSGQRMTEKAWLKSPMRWSGAWEGWGAKPPTPAAKEEESTIDWTQTPQRPRPNSSRIPRSAPNFSKPLQPIPVAAGTPDKEGWGLGFMSAWWTEPPASSRNLAAASSRPPSGTEDRRQDFQMGEGETRWISTSPTSLSGDAGAVGESSTPGHTNTSMTLSGVSTPSFGMRIHASAERKWARAEIVRRPAATDTAAPPTWLASIPMETGSSGVSIESHRPMATADSNASNLTSSSGGEREFPFSSHCRPPSCSIPSTSSSLVSVPSEIQHLREARGPSSGGLGNGSFPSDRTLHPRMLHPQARQDAVETLTEEREGAKAMMEERPEKGVGLLQRRHVRPLMLGEMLNPFPAVTQTTEQRSSTFHLATHTINPSPTSQSPTSASSQTHFFPPPTTPLTPSDTSRPAETLHDHADVEAQDQMKRQYLASTLRRQPSFARSSSPCDLSGLDGDIQLPVPSGPTAPLYPSTSREHAEVETGRYRDATPSVHTAVMPKQRKAPTALLFWLGFIMPWCWIFGGWPVASEGSVRDVEKGEVESKQSWLARWLHHPDPWATRSRIATVTVLPAVAVAGVAGVIVLAILRGR